MIIAVSFAALLQQEVSAMERQPVAKYNHSCQEQGHLTGYRRGFPLSGQCEHLRVDSGQREHRQFDSGQREHLFVEQRQHEHLRVDSGQCEHLQVNSGQCEYRGLTPGKVYIGDLSKGYVNIWLMLDNVNIGG